MSKRHEDAKIRAIIDYCLSNNISFHFHVVDELKAGNYQIDVYYKQQWIANALTNICQKNGIDEPEYMDRPERDRFTIWLKDMGDEIRS